MFGPYREPTRSEAIRGLVVIALMMVAYCLGAWLLIFSDRR